MRAGQHGAALGFTLEESLVCFRWQLRDMEFHGWIPVATRCGKIIHAAKPSFLDNDVEVSSVMRQFL